jgi:hypothetical protein
MGANVMPSLWDSYLKVWRYGSLTPKTLAPFPVGMLRAISHSICNHMKHDGTFMTDREMHLAAMHGYQDWRRKAYKTSLRF